MSMFAADAMEADRRRRTAESVTSVDRVISILRAIILWHHDRIAGTEEVVSLSVLVNQVVVVDLTDFLFPGRVPDQLDASGRCELGESAGKRQRLQDRRIAAQGICPGLG